ncbi:MAG: hypothetical protein ACRCZ9_01955, partial [Fusobacteriaceae bacterium]
QVQKVSVNLDMGDEIVQVVMGLGTHTAKSILQCLSIAADSSDGLPKHLKLAFKRGDREPNAVFCQVSGKSEGGRWQVIDTRDNPSFDYDKSVESVESYCLRLLDRLMVASHEASNDSEEFTEVYSFDEAF